MSDEEVRSVAEQRINEKIELYQKEIQAHAEVHKKKGIYTDDKDAAISYLLAKIAIIEWQMED